MKSSEFLDKRLSPAPHYFAEARIGKVYPDPESSKEDYFAEIINFIPFAKAVPAKTDAGYFEVIPKSKENNYWRDGVRLINKETFHTIMKAADFAGDAQNINDLNQGTDKSLESYEEGKPKVVYTTKYERDPLLRQQAVLYHGYSCMACGFNFHKKYGEWGVGFIHVHHVKPLSEGMGKINAKDDLIVVCANCHSMIHRRRVKTLTLEELKAIIRTNG